MCGPLRLWGCHRRLLFGGVASCHDDRRSITVLGRSDCYFSLEERGVRQ